MRIAQIAPLYESVPPKSYGGTERVVSYLTEGLVRRGHEVTLFASGDSVTQARLMPGCARALRFEALAGRSQDPLVHHLVMLEEVAAQAERFELIHAHCDYLGYPLARRIKTPLITTLHGRLDLPDLITLHDRFSEQGLVSISDAQRAPLPSARWLKTVHHGLPLDLYPLQPQPGQYLAFIGRISKEKRVDRAIAVADALQLPLRIAAKVDLADRTYFEEEIKPLLASPYVEFVGEIGQEQKAEFLGNALALLFLVDWPEPFGLAMIEALACGTPVVASACGSIPEIIDQGVTGMIVEDVAQAVEAVAQVAGFDRARIRAVFEARFSQERMVRDYEELYLQQQEHRFRLQAAG